MNNINMVFEEDIIPIKKKLKHICIHDGCDKRSSFNSIGESRPQYCAGHKQPKMVNVLDKKCEYDGCYKIPNFNNPGETSGKFCNGHKKPEMVDVVHKKCEHTGCNKIPNFNNPGETNGKFCNGHKEPEMVDVKNKKCEHDGCYKQPNFNLKNSKNGRFCDGHKQPDMVNVINKTCLHDWCDTQITKKYEGYCLRCYIYKYPYNTITKNYKTKETNVVEFIKASFPNYTWISDRIVQDGCSRRRPDLLLDFGDFIFIIEVDENQHVDYDNSCENRRIMEISRDLGHRNIVFIRFNPDDYIIGGKKITSCWGTDGNGICVVKKSKTKEWLDRLTALKEKVNECLDKKWSDKMIDTIPLFYDEK
jgi:hypothetical protein